MSRIDVLACIWYTIETCPRAGSIFQLKGAKVGDKETGRIIRSLLEEVISKEIHPVLQDLHRAQLDNRRVFRMMAEMVTGMEVMSKVPDAVSIFGSARCGGSGAHYSRPDSR